MCLFFGYTIILSRSVPNYAIRAKNIIQNKDAPIADPQREKALTFSLTIFAVAIIHFPINEMLYIKNANVKKIAKKSMM